MNILGKKKIVLLGMMSKMPVAGVVWQTVHYLVGFQRLGYDVYYVEAHARTPSMFMEREEDDGSGRAATFIASVMRRFDLGDHWAFHALHEEGQCYGLSEGELKRLYDSAELLINLHGGTEPLPEHSATGRLVYLETDPVELQIELYHNLQQTIDFLEPHCAFFTFGENYGKPDCKLPISERFHFRPTRQPVVIDFWQPYSNSAGDMFTTVGNWQQPWREVEFQGEIYSWSKHYEFLKFLDLPSRTDQAFELALSSYDEVDKRMLESKGWKVRHALDFSFDLDIYRRYIAHSHGEFTVAKDQNVRLRSGWFSDRSATYLAAGRPVITQETGFSNILPTGRGLFAFSTMEEILQAVEVINSDYELHCRDGYELARDYFSYDVVLTRLLADLGLEPRSGRLGSERAVNVGCGDVEESNDIQETVGHEQRSSKYIEPFSPTLVLTPLARRPIKMPDETIQAVMTSPIPTVSARGMDISSQTGFKRVSIVVVTFNNLVFNKMCLASLLVNTGYPNYEVIVVDNGSTDGTTDYLRNLEQQYPHVRVMFNDCNRGFAAANNQGLAIAVGDVLVLLNNDTVVPHKWLTNLVRHLEDPAIGAVGPVTNRIGNEAEIEVSYRTYGEFVEFVQKYTWFHKGEIFDIRTLCMFCLAMRRDVYEHIGPLDERFEVGMFEDDDYAMRVRAAGYRVVCAEDGFVHHFGQASIGKLSATGEYGKLFHVNRRRWEEKWGVSWQPHQYRLNQQYQQLADQIREVVCSALPSGATVIVVSKGDEELLKLGGRQAWHFPQTEDGCYAGCYPVDSVESIVHLEALRGKGGDFLLFPRTALWWLDHYTEFKQYLERQYRVVVRQEDTCVIFALCEPAAVA